MADRPDPGRAQGGPPTLQMVLSGGVGVFAVIAFVAALALGSEVKDAPPGARLGVTAAEGPAGLAVLAPRCRDERVRRVELRSADDVPRWRITARKGSIDERYVVGAAEVPLGFVTEVTLEGPLATGPVTVEVELAGERFDSIDRIRLDPTAVPAEGVLHQGEVVGLAGFEARASAAADCAEGRELGLVTWLFVAAAIGVVVTYGMMVARFWKGRSPSR